MPIRTNVFISSTNKDMELKWGIVDGVLHAGMYPNIWEFMPPTSVGPVNASASLIDDSEIFIGVYAQWYGGIPPEPQSATMVNNYEPVSWIEKEYNRAYEANKKLLIFILSENATAAWPIESTSTGESAKKLDDFKKKLKERHKVNFFVDRDDIFRQVGQYLNSPPYMDNFLNKIIVEPLFGAPSSAPQFKADVFMVMPFLETMRPVYVDHIKPVVERLGLTIKRGDDFFTTQGIMDDIWAIINKSEIVIADCTGKNPNVFYEIGVAHTLGKPTILITQNTDDVPFDLRHLRYIKYDYTPRGMNDFMIEVEEAIKKITQ